METNEEAEKKGSNMAQSSSAWISCKVKPGMFDNEFAVLIELANGETISLFADRSLIRFHDSTPFLEVNLVEEPREKGDRTVLLPTESFEKGSRWVTVPAGRLAPA